MVRNELLQIDSINSKLISTGQYELMTSMCAKHVLITNLFTYMHPFIFLFSMQFNFLMKFIIILYLP